MPDASMIRHYGSIEIAFHVYCTNLSWLHRNALFSRHPLLAAKRDASR